jgi:predicted TIM-barrel fold metal-dependent hydrolase
MIFDAHTHVGPSLFYEKPLYPGVVGADLVAIMDRVGIDKACVFAPYWIGGGEFVDPDFDQANRAVYEATKEFPDRLIGYGRVNPKLGRKALDELERCIQDYRFRGLKLHPDTEGYDTSCLEIMAPIYERMVEANWVSFYHTGYAPTCQPALFVPLAKAFPSVPIILAHIGYRYWEDAALVAREFRNVYLETAGNSTPSTINGAIRVAGADHVLFGTDSPYHDPQYCIDKVELLPDLTDEERKLVMGGNMARLLGMQA